MVADTKKGRPKTVNRILADAAYQDKEPRTAVNMLFAARFIHEVMGDNNSFFVNSRGAIRRQGIAEQIGRMLEGELITDEEARALVQEAVTDYNNGTGVKEIEKALRLLRLNLQAAGSSPNSDNIE